MGLNLSIRTSLLVGALTFSALFVSQKFLSSGENESQQHITQTSIQLASQLSGAQTAIELHLEQIKAQTQAIAAVLTESAKDPFLLIPTRLAKNSSIVGVSLFSKQGNLIWRAIPAKLRDGLQLNPEDFDRMDEAYKIKGSGRTRTEIQLGSLKNSTPILRMPVPVPNSGYAVVDFYQESLVSTLVASSSLAPIVVVDSKNRVFLSSDPEKFPFGGKVKNLGSNGRSISKTALTITAPENFETTTRSPASLQSSRKPFVLSIVLALLAAGIAFMLAQRWSKSVIRLSESIEQAHTSHGGTLQPLGFTAPAELQRLAGAVTQFMQDRVQPEYSTHTRTESVPQGVAQLSSQGEGRSATIVKFRIRQFDFSTQNLPPEQVINILNVSFSKIERVLLESNAWIAQQNSESMTAVWGLSSFKENPAEQAVSVCIEVRKAWNELLQQFAAQGLPSLSLGMGINHGMVIVGSVGTKNTQQYRVAGASVQIASEVELFAEQMGLDVLLTQTVINQVPDTFLIRKQHEIPQAGPGGSAITLFSLEGWRQEPNNQRQPIQKTVTSGLAPQAPPPAQQSPTFPNALGGNNKTLTQTAATTPSVQEGIAPPPTLADPASLIEKSEFSLPSVRPTESPNTSTHLTATHYTETELQEPVTPEESHGTPEQPNPFEITKRPPPPFEIQESTLSEIFTEEGSLDLSDFKIVKDD